MRAEYKGILSISGRHVSEPPSKYFPQIKFHRFPARLQLELMMPKALDDYPHIVFVLVLGGSRYVIDQVPQRDQLIVKSEWIPLVPEEVQEGSELLAKHNITDFNRLTIKQTFELIKEKSSILKILSEPVDTEHKLIDNSILDQCEQKLAQSGFKYKLYPYQLTGVSWMLSIAEQGIGFLLADEMGLGKTAQIISVILMNRKVGRQILIVVPATIMENWRRELGKFSPSLNVLIHSGPFRTGFPSTILNYDIVITSYDLAVRDQSMLAGIPWDLLILDEAQAIKNPQTRRAQILKQYKRRLALAITGTPLENKLLDIWSIMDFVNPELLGSRQTFESLFSDNVDDASLLEAIVSPLMLRRLTSDVATDLPPKIFISHPIDMSDMEAEKYESYRAGLLEKYGEGGVLHSLVKLRQYCTHPMLCETSLIGDPVKMSNKYRRLTEIIDDVYSGNDKLVVFVSFQKMADIMVIDLHERFMVPVFRIDGRTPINERQSIIDAFSSMAGSAILILNPRAAGVGLNITAASHVIHYNLEWNPAVEDQATARVHRIGQKVPVFVYRLFYPDTIDEVINDKLENKRDLSHAAVKGTDGISLNKAEILKAITISPINRGYVE
jgi:SNF2 family DNA or RNA helicase